MQRPVVHSRFHAGAKARTSASPASLLVRSERLTKRNQNARKSRVAEAAAGGVPLDEVGLR
jgi:hypothetical protein